MYVAERAVYLQLQKTATNQIIAILDATVGGIQHEQHSPLSIDPGERLVFGSIRNPWDYYVSLWAFGCRGGSRRGGQFKRQVRERPSLLRVGTETIAAAFNPRRRASRTRRRLMDARRQRQMTPEQWSRLYGDANDPTLFREWLAITLDPAYADELGTRYGKSSLRFVAGPMTHRYLRCYSRQWEDVSAPDTDWTLDRLIDFDLHHNVCAEFVATESLGPDLVRVLGSAGYELSADQESLILEMSFHKANQSNHRTFEDYYDDASIALVGERDSFVVRKHGYEAPKPIS